LDLSVRKWRKAGEECIIRSSIICTLHQNAIREMKSRLRRAGHVAGMEEIRNVYKILGGKPKGKRPLGRPRR